VKRHFSPAFAILGIFLFFVSALANTPPVASFEFKTSPDGSQTTLIFDATNSHDPDGAIVTYQWIFGDGYSGSGVTKSHIFPGLGKYEVTLNVIDNGGASRLISQTIDLSQPIIEQTSPGESAVAAMPSVVIPYNIAIGNRSGERAPAFALVNQAGETVELTDFLGHVVLVEFWSSSCSACQAAMPHLEELRAEFANRGLIVITITVNRNFEGEWQYLSNNGFTQFIALRESDPIARPTREEYDISVIPAAFLIDQRGVIYFTGHMNLVQSDMIESLL
jgi:thiol-disulfide isomerase/thioredoxin